MKVVKNKAQAILILMAILLTQNVFAQRGMHHKFAHTGFSEALQEELNLTTEQKAQLETLKVDFKEKKAALIAEETEDHSEKKAAMKSLMEAHRTAINEIFTKEQQAILKENRTEHKTKRQERMSKVDRKRLKTELKAYRAKNIEPTLLIQRAKLESTITDTDKKTIEILRTTFEEKKAVRKATMKARKENGHKSHKAKRKMKREELTNDEDRKALKALVEKYEKNIDGLFAEIAPKQEKWKADQKAIMQKYRGEAAKKRPERTNRKQNGKKAMMGKPHQKGKMMRKGAFLLLIPNQTKIAVSSGALTTIKVYPNPASSTNTLAYTVKEAGRIKIEIHDAQGKLVRVLLDANKELGEYQLNANLSDLKNRIYYYVVSDKQGVSTKKFVIAAN